MKHLLKSHHTLEIKVDERDLKGRDLFKRYEINCAGIGYGNGTGDGATLESNSGFGTGYGIDIALAATGVRFPGLGFAKYNAFEPAVPVTY